MSKKAAEPLRCGEAGCARGVCGHAHCDHCGACVSVESGHKFRDNESWKEWHISQTCQACQDAVFA